MRYWLSTLVVAVLWASPVSAGPILYTFSGTIDISLQTHVVNPDSDSTSVRDDPAELAFWLPGLTYGANAYTGSLRYDPDAVSLNHDRMQLNTPNVQFTIGNHVFASSGSMLMSVSSNQEVGDHMSLVDFIPTILTPIPGNAFRVDDMVLGLGAPLGDALFGLGVPPDLDGFNTGRVVLDGSFYGLNTVNYSWVGTVDQIQRTPEPATLLLVLLGLPMLRAFSPARRLSS